MFELIGYDEEIKSLINTYSSNNLQSSIILHGPKGIGKKTFINKFISEILKISLNEKNYLHHINLFKNNTHPNIKILEKNIDLKTKKIKNNITIDQIRDLKKFINESPSVDDLKKIIIIDSADDLNINAANSLLKTLEETKINTLIFLISHQISSLLPTIRSRCLKFKLNKHNYDNFKKILLNNIDYLSDDEIKFYYDLSYGSPGNSILLNEDKIIDVFDMTLSIFNSNQIDNNCIDLVNILSKLDNDKFKSYLFLLKSILVILNKIKTRNNNSYIYLSNKFKHLEDISKNLTLQKIIDRFDFLSNNESDLLTYNLDKKLFMFKFLTS